jgi:hypothetical protein
MAERTGCPILLSLWSYVKELVPFKNMYSLIIEFSIQSLPLTVVRTSCTAHKWYIDNIEYRKSEFFRIDAVYGFHETKCIG